MTVIWGIVGMLVGVIIAAQLVWPELNMVPGRLRPPASNAVGLRRLRLFATSYWCVQRTSHVACFGPLAHSPSGAGNHRAWLAVTFPLGITGQEYAELEWPIDILITLVWVAYASCSSARSPCRKVSAHLRGQLVLRFLHHRRALLHIVNSAGVPVSLTKSYSAYAGVQDAMVQWWYGHNAVGFFLTAGFLGMMYYFVPKQAGRPVYLSPVGGALLGADLHLHVGRSHHLHYTALPDWAQSVGMVFSLILLAPQLGRHDQRHHDPVGRLGNCARSRS